MSRWVIMDCKKLCCRIRCKTETLRKYYFNSTAVAAALSMSVVASVIVVSSLLLRSVPSRVWQSCHFWYRCQVVLEWMRSIWARWSPGVTLLYCVTIASGNHGAPGTISNVLSHHVLYRLGEPRVLRPGRTGQSDRRGSFFGLSLRHWYHCDISITPK